MTFRNVLLCIVLLSLLPLISCVSRGTVQSLPAGDNPNRADTNSGPVQEVSIPAQISTSPVIETPAGEVIPEAAGPGTEDGYTGDYVVGPEDLLDITVYQVDELNRTVRVSASGYIKLPLAGTLMASGRTVPELEAEIGRLLEPYLQEPLVSVFIREYRGQSITVLGAVAKPQVYIVTRQRHLIDMISVAGGLAGNAGDICYIRRGNETIIVNIDKLLVQGDMNLNIPVFSGDIIHVPSGGIIFVDGAVSRPGSFGMQGAITLTQAIAMAGGFSYTAIRDQIRIYRDSGKTTQEIIEVDYDAILDKKSEDVLLSTKDIVIVPKSGVKELWSGFVRSVAGTIRLGQVSVGAGL